MVFLFKQLLSLKLINLHFRAKLRSISYFSALSDLWMLITYVHMPRSSPLLLRTGSKKRNSVWVTVSSFLSTVEFQCVGITVKRGGYLFRVGDYMRSKKVLLIFKEIKARKYGYRKSLIYLGRELRFFKLFRYRKTVSFIWFFRPIS